MLALVATLSIVSGINALDSTIEQAEDSTLKITSDAVNFETADGSFSSKEVVDTIASATKSSSDITDLKDDTLDLHGHIHELVENITDLRAASMKSVDDMAMDLGQQIQAVNSSQGMLREEMMMKLEQLRTELLNETSTLDMKANEILGFVSSVQDKAIQALQETKILRQRVDALNASTPVPDPTKKSCKEHFDDGFKIDGTYTIMPDGSNKMKAYCDMTSGGWTLVGMIHTADKSGVDEPNDWFHSPSDSELLQSNTNKVNESPMGLGGSRFASYIRNHNSPMVKFVIHAHEDFDQTNTWYKDLSADDQTFTSLFDTNNIDHRSKACRDEKMTEDCIDQNYIGKSPSGVTICAGCEIKVNGQGLGGAVHMRQNDDPIGDRYSGLCSGTLNNALWKDSNFDGHWGNAGRLWLN